MHHPTRAARAGTLVAPGTDFRRNPSLTLLRVDIAQMLSDRNE